MSFEDSGAARLRVIGARLKAEGAGALRRQMLAAIRAAASPAIPAVEQSARDNQPHTGGLADRVAGQRFAVRTSLAAGRVSIIGQGMKELRDINAGRLRHPVFDNRSRWVQQDVTPGFFSDPIMAERRPIQVAVLVAVRRVAEQIAKGV